MWLVAAVAGLVTVATGLLPLDAARAVTDRALPVLAFLVAVTVLAELADRVELFDVAAVRAARWGRGRTPLLWLLVVALGTVTTVLLSLDTTAVLLTPVVLVLARRLGLPALPFAVTAVWLANTTSLLLPVSNLTTLLAVRRLDLSSIEYAGRMLLPAAAALLATVIVLGIAFRRHLVGRYPVPPTLRPADPVLTAVAGVACLALGPAVLLGVPAWLAGLAAASVVAVGVAVRHPDVLRSLSVPWRLVLLVEGLFLVVTAAGLHGLDDLLAAAQGTSGTGLGALRTAGVAALAANGVDNLPAFLALERAVPDGGTTALLALLIGVNCGPLITPWASLATLLWRDRCRAAGVAVPTWQLVRLGLVGAPVVVAAAAGALLL